MKNSLEIYRGKRRDIVLEIIKDDERYFLHDNDIVIFEVRKYTDGEIIIHKEMSAADETDEGVVFSILPDDTENIPYGEYAYDIIIIMGDDLHKYAIIEYSPFMVKKNIAKGIIEYSPFMVKKNIAKGAVENG